MTERRAAGGARRQGKRDRGREGEGQDRAAQFRVIAHVEPLKTISKTANGLEEG